MIEVPSDRHEPLVLRVQHIYPDNTSLQVDNRSLAVANFQGPDLTFNEDELIFDFAGGLVPGLYTLQLVTRRRDEDELPSTPVALTVVPSQITPTLVAELAPAVLATGQQLAHTGTSGLHGALLVREDGPEPVLHLLHGWDPNQTYDVPLVGFEPSAHLQTMGVTASVLRAPSDELVPLLQVAWHTGSPANAVVGHLITGPAGGSFGDPVSLVTEDLLATTPHEWFGVGRTLLAGDTLVSEVHIPVDTEVSHPGDDRLLTRTWNAETGILGPIHLLTGPELEDYDTLAPALDLIGLANNEIRAFSVRRKGSAPALLVQGPSGWSLDAANPTASLGFGGGADLWSTTSRGSLWSWQSWSVSRAGDALVTQQQAIANTAVSRLTTPRGPNGLPDDAAPSAEPSLTLVNGTPILLLPYGPEIDVHAVSTTGEEVSVQALTDLRCDALAVTQSLAGNAEVPQVPIACLLADEVRRGTIATQ